MVSSETFFSTLTLASATIVSFVIAFGAVIYQLERQDVNNRTRRLRRSSKETRDKYLEIIDLLLIAFMSEIDIDPDILFDMDEDIFSARDKALEIGCEKPNSAYMCAILYRISTLLKHIEPHRRPKLDYLLTPEEYTRLTINVSAMNTVLSNRHTRNSEGELKERYSGVLEGLAKELVDSSEIDQNLELFDDNQLSHNDSDGSNRLQDWLKKNSGEENWIGNWIEETELQKDETPTLNGKNVYSLKIFFDEFVKDIDSLSTRSKFTRVDYNPSIQPVLKRSVGLVIVGVFLPMATLIHLPRGFSPSFSGIWLSVYQISLLVASSMFAVYLILGLFKEISDDATSIETSSKVALKSFEDMIG